MPSDLERLLLAHGRGEGEPSRPRLVATPLLRALRDAGTQHVYGDSADVQELGDTLSAGDRAVHREVDGNTANQPLVRKVAPRYLDAGEPRAWASDLGSHRPDSSRAELFPLLYAIVCGRVGNDMSRAFAGGRDWEVSLQLHMGLCGDPERARWVGRRLREMVPTAFVKVPFTPDAPHCFLVARDLEQAGVPVNFTSTFSARQAVAAALLADVTRTNVFMGRLNQGLEAELLGEHVDLETQRALHALRRQDAVKTQLIVASMRDWQTFLRVAGCDVFTAPCEVLQEFLDQDEVGAEDLESRLETSYEDRLGVSPDVLEQLGSDRIARLYRVEPEFIEFLRELRRSPGHATLVDGDALRESFEKAGFGDLFHAPTAEERDEMERGKLPALDGVLVDRVPLDTHYSLLANADFARHQREIDREVAKRLGWDDLP